MAYNINDKLKLRAIEFGKDSNDNDFLTVVDDVRQYRVYTNPIKFDEDDLPIDVDLIVSKIDVFGRVCFRLNVGKLFAEHYELNRLYQFTVIDNRIDPNTNAKYYVIGDDFAEHRYYTDECLEIGEDCILLTKEFNNKGFITFAHIQDSVSQQESVEEPVQVVDVTVEAADVPYILDIGDEGTTLELKTSIAFPPEGNGEADIDEQLDKIIKVICAFMNTQGGKLYIGVKDVTKRVVGIADDYKHLNDSETDEYQYNENHDGYELKIRNTIDRKCTSVVNSLIEFSFQECQGLEYCVIDVKKSKRPVWFNGVQLWVRQGCRNKQLKGDSISLFVTELMTISIQDKLDFDGIDIVKLSHDERNKTLKGMIYNPSDVKELPAPPSLDKVSHWINWFSDGSWIRTKENVVDKQYCIQVPVLENINDPRILFCYSSGRVNSMKLSDFRKNTRQNTIVNDRPWNKENGMPINIIVASPTDLLFGISRDCNGIDYVKFHSVNDFKPTQSSKNQGAPFVPDGFVMERFCAIGSYVSRDLAQLQCTKQQRSQDAGKPINSNTFSSEMAMLRKLGIL